MRFLVDESLSWTLADRLQFAGYDAVHARDVNLLHAKDKMVLDYAVQDTRMIITQETDFGTLLAERNATGPSVLLFRARDARPESQSALLLAYLPALSQAITDGAIVVFDDFSIRIRRLPIGRKED